MGGGASSAKKKEATEKYLAREAENAKRTTDLKIKIEAEARERMRNRTAALLQKNTGVVEEGKDETADVREKQTKTSPIPSQAETIARWGPVLQMHARAYCKTASVHAKVAEFDGTLATVLQGTVETTKRYNKGDFIIHGVEGERYTMSALDFSARYDRSNFSAQLDADSALAKEGFRAYVSKGRIWARALSADEVTDFFPEEKFVTRWGSVMRISSGDFLAMPFPNGDEIYRIEKKAFAVSYQSYDSANYLPTQAEVLAAWGGTLRKDDRIYVETAKIHAKVAMEGGVLEVIVNGVTESRKPYEAGDFIVLYAGGERFSMTPHDFAARYDRSMPLPAKGLELALEGFRMYAPIGKLWAYELSADDVSAHFPTRQFIASHGGPVTVEATDYLVAPCPGGNEVYRIKKATFVASYSLNLHVPSQAETVKNWEGQIRFDARVFCKAAKVDAMLARKDGELPALSVDKTENMSKYKKGDFIINSAEGRYFMKQADFTARYDLLRPEPATDVVLDEEGFSLYSAKGKVWGCEISKQDVDEYFPAGHFIASWGAPIIVKGGDYLVVPFPEGGEVYGIDRSVFERTYAEQDRSKYTPSQTEALEYWETVIRREGTTFCRPKLHAYCATEDGETSSAVSPEGSTKTTSRRLSYKKGDIVLQSAKGERHIVDESDFAVHTDPCPTNTDDSALAKEGFEIYQSTAKVWAREISLDEVTTHFPAGLLVASWGSPTEVLSGDFLALPYPNGGELFCIKRAVFKRRYTPLEQGPFQQAAFSDWAGTLRDEGKVYFKTASIHARQATAAGEVEKNVDGVSEGVSYFESGDYIIVGSRGGKYAMKGLDFSARYCSDAPSPATQSKLADEGFNLYAPRGKIWAYKLSPEQLATHFPSGVLTGAWGGSAKVHAGDILAMPFPTGGEIYTIGATLFENTYQLDVTLGEHVPSQDEVLSVWDKALRAGDVFRKTAKVHAKLMRDDGIVETVVNGIVEARMPYTAGDFILQGSRGGRYSMTSVDFTKRYERGQPEPASEHELAREGFELYRPTGRIWARTLSTHEAASHFPAGQLLGRWGGPTEVRATDYLAMPHPEGGEVYRITKALFVKTYMPENFVPSQEETLQKWGVKLRNNGHVFCKTAKAMAKLATEDGVLETVVRGTVETSKSYEKGDFIIQGTEGERYTMAPLDFLTRYDRLRPEPPDDSTLEGEGFQLYPAKGKVWALQITEHDISESFPAGQFIAPWGSPMLMTPEDFFAMPFPAGNEIYRIEKIAFQRTYAKEIQTDHVPSQTEVFNHWGAVLRSARLFAKVANMYAKAATKDGEVELTNGSLKKYYEGDFILRGAGEREYHAVMTADKFLTQFEHVPEMSTGTGFELYRPVGKVWAYKLCVSEMKAHFPSGKFIASWGTTIETKSGDYLAMPFPNGDEVFGITKTAFEETYAEDTDHDPFASISASLSWRF